MSKKPLVKTRRSKGDFRARRRGRRQLLHEVAVGHEVDDDELYPRVKPLPRMRPPVSRH